MANVGLKMLYFALRDTTTGKVITDKEKGLSETGVYLLDTNKANMNLGTKSANITGLAGTSTPISGNDEVVDLTNPTASPSVAIDSNLVNPTVLQKMLGRTVLSHAGYVDGEANVEVALIVESSTLINLKSVFYCFGRGILNQASQNIQTNTDTAETREDDILTYKALSTPEFNKKPFAIFYEGDKDFDKAAMFNLVMPGQTLYTSTTGTQGSQGLKQ